MDVHVHDTYFVIAHFHYIMVGGTVMAYLGGIHFWWPKMTGRMYPEWWGRFAACIIFIGFNLTFFPQFIPRIPGHAAAISCLSAEFQVYNVMSTAGASILAVGYLAAAVLSDLVVVVGQGCAGTNPWGAPGLEWQTTSPPPTFNFDETPVVTDRSLRLRTHRGAR